MGTIGMEFLTNVSEIINLFGTTEIRTPDLLLENHVVLTLLLSFISERIELAIFVWKKKKNDRTEWINFLAYYIRGEK